MQFETEHGVNPGTEADRILQSTERRLIDEGIPAEVINQQGVRVQTVLYMCYWHNRLKNNKEEQERISENLIGYLGENVPDAAEVADHIFSNKVIRTDATEYVETIMVPVKTVDLVIVKTDAGDAKDKEILCAQRNYYPLGLALPGGFIQDSDEDNVFGLTPEIFAALRVAGEKILGLGEQAVYFVETDAQGRVSYLVRSEDEQTVVRLYPQDQGGYRYRENVKRSLRPADPRHLVDTVGFRCEIEGQIHEGLSWRRKSEIMSPDELTGGFAFGHHREIVAQITSQTSFEKERQMKERDFVRSLVDRPLETYRLLQQRFAEADNSSEASFPELFPVVDRLLSSAFSDEINRMCVEIPLLAGVRDKAVIALRQVCLKNRTFCPYLPTLHAISAAVAFFDLVARQKKGFYDTMDKDRIVEHNPRKTPHASYHMYRYKYRYDQLVNMVPDELVIPTFESLSATDLMKVRGIPVRFIGISTDFLYVDEFEQSPEEFFMHDANHSWRMVMEDRETQEKYGMSKDELIEASNRFITEYLQHIKVRKEDSEEVRELKKLKKMILFEIVHEDARPLLPEVVGRYVQMKEGQPVKFEGPYIDPHTGYMDVVETMDTGISTLSYVRNKLQHGFYDHADAQLTQIVDPQYRTAAWIARAAYEMLVELNSVPESGADLDEYGHVSYEWLLRRACAVGPDNIHEVESEDPDVAVFGDGGKGLNEKRYQLGVAES